MVLNERCVFLGRIGFFLVSFFQTRFADIGTRLGGCDQAVRAEALTAVAALADAAGADEPVAVLAVRRTITAQWFLAAVA